MELPPLKLTLLIAVLSFGANWPFGYQITYVNTAVLTFYRSFLTAYHRDINCTVGCPIPYQAWTLEWGATVASFYPGAVLGFALVPWLVKTLGTRRALLVSGVPGVLGCLLSLFGRGPAVNTPLMGMADTVGTRDMLLVVVTVMMMMMN